MSYQIGVLKHQYGKKVKIYDGYSIPCLIFGPIWFLFKGMGSKALFCLITDLVTGFIGRLVWAFFANKLHRQYLLQEGFMDLNNFNFENFNYKRIKTKNISQKDTSDNESSLGKVVKLKEEILEQIKKTKKLNNRFIDEIKLSLDKYVEYTKQLMERESEISSAIENYSIDTNTSLINDLKNKFENTQNQELKKEYEKNIKLYESEQKSFKEVCEQREMIKLKISSILMNLKQIKLNIIKMDGVVSQEQTNDLVRLFEEQTSGLSNYVEHLKKSYNELNRTLI